MSHHHHQYQHRSHLQSSSTATAATSTHCPMEVCTSPSAFASSCSSVASTTSSSMSSSSSAPHNLMPHPVFMPPPPPALTTPRRLRRAVGSAAGAAVVGSAAGAAVVGSAAASSASSSPLPAPASPPPAPSTPPEDSGNDLPVVREQANLFFRTLVEERQLLLSRRRRQMMRTAPPKFLLHQQQQQQLEALGSQLQSVNRVLTFDDDEEDDADSAAGSGALPLQQQQPALDSGGGRDTDQVLMPPPKTPAPPAAASAAAASAAGATVAERLLLSVRGAQARMYRRCGALSRLPGSNINRCTPEGRRRLSGGSGCGSSGGSGLSGGASSLGGVTGRLVDERLLNSDRLFKEFDLTDQANTKALASGSFGFVFSAMNRLDGRVYCIKTARSSKLRNGPSASAQTREGIQEVWAMSGLSERHPNIVEYYGCWVQFDRLYIQLEFCNGLCLRSYLMGDLPLMRRSLPSHRLRQLASDIGSALAFMHTEGLAHLDCATANILLKAPRVHLPPDLAPATRRSALATLAASPAERLVFKLGDFGHARDARDTENLEDGTGQFMPVDALDLAKHPDPRLVDNFSLGLCLVEAAGGCVPASTDSPVDGPARLRLLESGHIDRPTGMEDRLYRLVLGLLRPDPCKRLSLTCLLRAVDRS